VPALGLNDHFDHIINSSSKQVLKSAIDSVNRKSLFFNQYLNGMGISPEDSVLIDNSLDAKRVEDVGMNFLHVTDDQPLSYHLNTILNNE
jgi:FMN phosphatase YigB (HAD superfamily)